MNAQPVRWPQDWPLILLGGCDTEYGGSRYFHLGPVAFSVDRQRGGWSFWIGGRRGSVKFRVYGLGGTR